MRRAIEQKRMVREWAMACYWAVMAGCLLCLEGAAVGGGVEGWKGQDTAFYWAAGDGEIGGRVEGKVEPGAPGPRGPVYPGFPAEQLAARFGGSASWLAFEDTGGEGSALRFRNGDAITIEAWVQLDEMGDDRNVYVLGKGRTGRPGFRAENQNYALRLRGKGADACVSFLFRSAANDADPGDWHRWTSTTGFRPGSRWHHIAVSYVFGEPESVRGYLDGEELEGEWDMGGASERAPVEDNDELWIGSTLGGSGNNSFKGKIAAVAVHRGVLEGDVMAARYAFDADKIPERPLRLVEGKVAAEIVGGIGAHNRWPDPDVEMGEAAWQWEQDGFVFLRVPAHFDGDGLREQWNSPMYFRAAAKVELPAGEVRLVLRSRGGTRLRVDGEIVAETPFMRTGGSAHGEVTPVPEPLSPGIRPLAYPDKELVVTVVGEGRQHLIVLESLVGAPDVHPSFGETLLAMEVDGGAFEIVAPLSEGRVPLVEGGAFDEWKWGYLAWMDELEAGKRRGRREAGAAEWAARHAAVREYISARPGVAVPEVGESGWPVANEIDRFLGARASEVLAGSAGGAGDGEGLDFHAEVYPILSENCVRCHGERERGGLRLDSREAALLAGDSGLAAVVPGDLGASYLLEVVSLTGDDDMRMPPKGDGLSGEEIAVLEKWVAGGAEWPQGRSAGGVSSPTAMTDDHSFLRRVYLDTVGVFPTAEEVREFVASAESGKRDRVIERLHRDLRWAGHWTAYWQDVLAENPSFLKPSLNNTGPFRWWIHDALSDELPMDWFVTELVRMGGSVHDGGPAGFSMAAENDVPMAAKAHVVGTAFLGVEMQCARCHDSPYHETTQRDLFEMAALLDEKAIRLPSSSSVPAAFFEGKAGNTLIKTTLKTGDSVAPAWPFDDLSPQVEIAGMPERRGGGGREELAWRITQPANERFAKVIVNRVWQRLMGRGLVEPVEDWEGNPPSHPELLDWLARELVLSGYDLKHISETIMKSHAYQRKAVAGANPSSDAGARLFAAPERRRMLGEQIVDGYLGAVGKRVEVEELSFNPDTKSTRGQGMSLGVPRRAWEFNAVSNERDRPSLALPKVQAVLDILEVMAWRPARAEPRSVREEEPNLLQPGVLSNGVFGMWLTRLSDDVGLVDFALGVGSVEELVDELFLTILGRPPFEVEQEEFLALLGEGFEGRAVPVSEVKQAPRWERLPTVTWHNHLSPEANTITEELERRVREGDPPTPRLEGAWRERLEDAVWALVNAPEAVFVP